VWSGGDYANLTINGNGHTVGAAGIVPTQASVNASLIETLNASANGDNFNMHQKGRCGKNRNQS
jgi:hypothetical protein